jgi:hypothetical protein
MFGVELYGNRTPNKREQRVIELVARELKKLRSRRRSRHGRALRQELPSRQLRQARAVEPVELAFWYEVRKHGQGTMG